MRTEVHRRRAFAFHPYPKRQLPSAAASQLLPSRNANLVFSNLLSFPQKMEIQMFTWNIPIFKYWQHIQFFVLFFNTMRAKLNKSVGWIQSTISLQPLTWNECLRLTASLSSPLLTCRPGTEYRKKETLFTWFDILILCLNHIVPSSPTSKKPPHLFKPSNS